MQEMTIGNLCFRSNGKTLTITARDRPGISFALDREGVEELIDYVSTLAGTEFNRRNAFRVPISKSSGLSAVIAKGSRESPVTPINLSLTGMLAQIPEEADIDPAFDDHVEVTLDYQGQKATYRAVVRRREEDMCGLFFPQAIKDEELDPPDSLLRVVMELQRQWLARRARRAT